MFWGDFLDYFKKGSSGVLVKKIQYILNMLGYKIRADAIFGNETENSIISYQQKYNLKVDGIVGPNTFESLLLDSGIGKEEAYINSRDFYSDTVYFIWANTIVHYVYIFKGKNREWKLMKKFLATVGKPSTPTLLGIFNVGAKGLGYGGPKYGFKVKWYIQYYKNYLFHSILINLDGKTVFDGRLGMDLSDGCIRLAEENAKYIYDNIPCKSLVLVT